MLAAGSRTCRASSARIGGYAMKRRRATPELYKVGQNTTRLLLCLGDLIVGWLLLRQAAVALDALAGTPSEKDVVFYQGKVAAAKFFAHQRFPCSPPSARSPRAPTTT